MAKVRIPPGFGQFSFFCTNPAGHRCATVMGVALADIPDQGDIDAVSSEFGLGYTDIISTSSAYVGCTFLLGQDGGAPLKMTSVTGIGAGGRGGAMCPPQVQAILAKRSALASRHGQGRNFSQDVLEGNVDNAGVISSTDLSLRTTHCGNMFTILGASPYDGMVILHTTALAPTVVTTYSVETKVATLRRRLPR